MNFTWLTVYGYYVTKVTLKDMARQSGSSYKSFLAPLLASIAVIIITAFWATNSSSQSTADNYTVEEFATGLDTPWGMAFLPDGRMLVTEKIGKLRLIDIDGSVSDPIEGLPNICVCGQGGLMDVQIHPAYDQTGWIYLAYSEPKNGEKGNRASYTAIMRAQLDGMRLINQEVVYRAPENLYSRRGQHFGSRIVFDNDGYMYFSIGDRGQRNDGPQSLELPNGKIHRLHDDGRIPDDNPFVHTEGAVASIWSYGHRNPQGLDFHAETNTLWETEHGPRGGDELNHIKKGLNYGWPVISFGRNYSGTKFTDLTAKDGMEQPAHHWTPSIATCGMAFYTGDLFPEWKDNVFVTSLKFGRIHRIVLDGTTVKTEEIHLKTGGRPRDILTGPDDYLYIAVEDSPGRIIRLVPD